MGDRASTGRNQGQFSARTRYYLPTEGGSSHEGTSNDPRSTAASDGPSYNECRRVGRRGGHDGADFKDCDSSDKNPFHAELLVEFPVEELGRTCCESVYSSHQRKAPEILANTHYGLLVLTYMRNHTSRCLSRSGIHQ